jgi:7-keto-8-aminopelargonate synthetase-like enzyme
VDTSHDLGATGPDGRGQIGLQGMLGQIDIVTGSFSTTFASNGGFVASNHPALKGALRMTCLPHELSCTLSPVQAAVVDAAMAIVASGEGEVLRQRLAANSAELRHGLTVARFTVFGDPSPIVPVLLGQPARSRRMTLAMLEAGVFVNLVEFPNVPRQQARWCLHVMAGHGPADIDDLIDKAIWARSFAGA